MLATPWREANLASAPGGDGAIGSHTSNSRGNAVEQIQQSAKRTVVDLDARSET
jgi:hypothetical protein